MSLSNYFRTLLGAAAQSDFDLASSLAASAKDARAAADAMKSFGAQLRTESEQSLARVDSELARLSARVEAMPEMRAQLENFVGSLGRTMTAAADRLETVDDRIHRIEQQSRTQTEILSLARAELDRQGRGIASIDGQLKFESQVKAFEEALTRLSAASERTETLVREMDERRVRIARVEQMTIAATILAAAAILVTLVR
jgi:chromosome segregation ATPase